MYFDASGELAWAFSTQASRQEPETSLAEPLPLNSSEFGDRFGAVRVAGAGDDRSERIVYLVGADNCVVRWRIPRLGVKVARKSEAIRLPKSVPATSAITGIFCSPDGRDTLFAVSTGDNCYVNSSSKEARVLTKLKGRCINSAVWLNPASSTRGRDAAGKTLQPQSLSAFVDRRVCLIGTNTGELLVSVLESESDSQRMPFATTVVTMSGEIRGLHVEELTSSTSTSSGCNDDTVFSILVLAELSLHHFMGGPSIFQAFSDPASTARTAVNHLSAHATAMPESIIPAAPGRESTLSNFGFPSVVLSSTNRSSSNKQDVRQTAVSAEELLERTTVFTAPVSTELRCMVVEKLQPEDRINALDDDAGAQLRTRAKSGDCCFNRIYLLCSSRQCIFFGSYLLSKPPSQSIDSNVEVMFSSYGLLDLDFGMTACREQSIRGFQPTPSFFGVLLQDKFVLISRISRKVAHELPLRSGASDDAHFLSLPLCNDTDNPDTVELSFVSGTAGSSLLALQIVAESSSTWRLFLAVRKFEDAWHCAATIEQREYILARQGLWLFSNCEYEAAAQVFAKCERLPFGDICLMFLSFNKLSALVILLTHQLRRICSAAALHAQGPTSSPEPHMDRTGGPTTIHHRVMLLVWAVELRVHILNELEAEWSLYEGTLADDNRRAQQNDVLEKFRYRRTELRSLLEEFSFIEEARSTVYAILTSLGRRADFLYFAEVSNDHRACVLSHISTLNYTAAIAQLRLCPPPLRDELIVRFAPILFLHEPQEFTTLCLSPGVSKAVHIAQLVPALLVPVNTDEADDRKQGCVGGGADSASTNFTSTIKERNIKMSSLRGSTLENYSVQFLEKFLKIQRDVQPDGKVMLCFGPGTAQINSTAAQQWLTRRLMSRDWLSAWSGQSVPWTLLLVLRAASTERDSEHFVLQLLGLVALVDVQCDLPLVLRICKVKNKLRAVAVIYGCLGLHLAAVEGALALEDLELAKRCARDAPADTDLQEKLWTVIFEYAASYEKDVSRVLDMLRQEGRTTLRVESALRCLWDSSLVELFKDDICQALQDCEEQAEENKRQIEAKCNSIQALKAQLRQLLRRKPTVSVTSVCEYCQRLLFAEVNSKDLLRTTEITAELKIYAFPCGHVVHAACCHLLVYSGMSAASRRQYRSLIKTLKGVVDKAKLSSNSEERLILHKEAQQLEQSIDSTLAAECPICGNLLIQSIFTPLLNFGDSRETKLLQDWNLMDTIEQH